MPYGRTYDGNSRIYMSTAEMRGWLVGLQEGSYSVDDLDEYISKQMTKARDHAYKLGVMEGRIMRSEVTSESSRCDMTPYGRSVLGIK